eukprot:COSAG01_NODE_860_length_13064_cov_23.466949_20_plen_79_part_00
MTMMVAVCVSGGVASEACLRAFLNTLATRMLTPNRGDCEFHLFWFVRHTRLRQQEQNSANDTWIPLSEKQWMAPIFGL